MDEELINALIKRAKGYSFSEVQEEYSVTDSGEIALTKRKVSEKYCPPDAAALKTYMEICKDGEISEMSDEELESEKHRLLVKLYEEEKAQKIKKRSLRSIADAVEAKKTIKRQIANIRTNKLQKRNKQEMTNVQNRRENRCGNNRRFQKTARSKTSRRTELATQYEFCRGQSVCADFV